MTTDNGVANFGLELVGACASDVPAFSDALATAAYCIINDQRSCFPGAVFPDVIRMYDLSETMSSVCFVAPFLWQDAFASEQLSQKKVAWLQMVPISDRELKLVREKGFKALEERFLAEQIDVYDINRPSVI